MRVGTSTEIPVIEVEVGPTVAVEVASGHDLIAMEAPVQRGEAHVAQAVGAALAVPDMTVDPGAEVGPVHVQVVRSVAVEVRRGQHFIAHPRRVERIQPVDPGVVPGRQAGLIGCAVVHDRLRVVRADVGFTFDRLR